MQNDTITISRHHSNDPAVKLAICHALAQVRFFVGCVRAWMCLEVPVWRAQLATPSGLLVLSLE